MSINEDLGTNGSNGGYVLSHQYSSSVSPGIVIIVICMVRVNLM